MAYYKVRVQIPITCEKTVYIDDAVNKTDARKKAKDWGDGTYDAFDFSGDENFQEDYRKLKVLYIEKDESLDGWFTTSGGDATNTK